MFAGGYARYGEGVTVTVATAKVSHGKCLFEEEIEYVWFSKIVLD